MTTTQNHLLRARYRLAAILNEVASLHEELNTLEGSLPDAVREDEPNDAHYGDAPSPQAVGLEEDMTSPWPDSEKEPYHDKIAAAYPSVTPKAPAPEETPAEPEAPAPEPEAEPTPEPEPAPAATLEQVRATLADLSRAGHTDQVRQLIQDHGAAKLSDVPADQYGSILAAAQEIAA